MVGATAVGIILAERSRVMSREYTKQFKDEAMRLVTVEGRKPNRVARDLGMPVSTLLIWLKRAGWKHPVESDLPPSDDPAVLQARIVELEQRVRRLEMEKEILKKATAFFANQNP